MKIETFNDIESLLEEYRAYLVARRTAPVSMRPSEVPTA
jgi:hypothetical protein